jgi:hypothetical protein
MCVPVESWDCAQRFQLFSGYLNVGFCSGMATPSMRHVHVGVTTPVVFAISMVPKTVIEVPVDGLLENTQNASSAAHAPENLKLRVDPSVVVACEVPACTGP